MLRNLIILIFLGPLVAFSQPDSLLDYQNYIERDGRLLEKFGLKQRAGGDQEKTYTFWSGRQVLQVDKSNEAISAKLVSFFFYNKASERSEDGYDDTLFISTSFSEDTAMALYYLLEDFNLDSFPEMESLDGWIMLAYGSYYRFVVQDLEQFQLKMYRDIREQSEMPEANSLVALVDAIDSLVDFEEEIRKRNMIAKKNGNYYDQESYVFKVENQHHRLGVISSYWLPFGVSYSLYINNITRSGAILKMSSHYRSDFSNEYDLFFGIVTYLKNYSNLPIGGIKYEFRDRLIHDEITSLGIVNHKISVSPDLEGTLGIYAGIDVFSTSSKEIGANFSVSKYFQNQYLQIKIESSIFKNRVDAEIWVDKYIKLNARRYFKTGLGYQRFFNRDDLMLKVSTYL